MYDVYIRYYKQGNTIINDETLMFSVPNTDGFPVNKPVVKADEDSAENFSFSMESNSPYYDAMMPLKTMLRVVYDGDVIFYGRVLSVSTSTVYHTKSVTCEGYFSFLNDTYYEGVSEKTRKKITASTYLDRIISNHNTNAPAKSINRGTIGVTLPSEEEYYEPTGWTQSSTLISNLSNNIGGHIRVRYSGTTPYLDWYKYYTRDLGNGNRPSVRIGRNILDINAEFAADEIFTRVIPIGDTDSSGKTIYIEGYKWNGSTAYPNKVFPVSFIRNLYSDAQLTDEFHSYTDYRDAETNYGVIYKTMTFSDADTKEKLWNMTKKWVKECYFGMSTSFTVKAVDMHIISTSNPKILLGECVDVNYMINRNGSISWENRKLVCKSVSYDLFNPENNSYTFGFPTDLLEHNRNNKKSSKKKNTASDASAPKKTVSSKEPDKSYTWYKIYQMIGSRDGPGEYEGTAAARSFYANGELSGTVECIDPDEQVALADIEQGFVNDHINDYIQSRPTYDETKIKKFTAKLVGKITLKNSSGSLLSVKWVAISSERGIFAYVENRKYNMVSYWYVKEKNVKYESEGKGANISSFETIAQMIEKDPDPTWGGAANATAFRNGGKINGSIGKAYDKTEHTLREAQNNPEFVFSAELVGAFSNKYVAISQEHGVFGVYAGARGIIPAEHWYSHVEGLTYDNIQSGFNTETGEFYLTDDNEVDGNKTIIMEPTFLGTDSKGKALFGYDLTSDTPKWKIELNVPIRYTDKDGNVVIKDGFVKADDFNIESIPSFKTKLGVFDVVIAGKVNATDIAAERAYINRIRGDTIVANTSVRAALIRGNTLRSDDFIINVTGSQDNPDGASHLGDCLKTCTVAKGKGIAAENDDANKYYLKFTNAKNIALTNIELPIDEDLASVRDYVNKIKSATIYNNTSVRADGIYGNTIRGSDVQILGPGGQQNPSGHYSMKTDLVKTAWFETGTGNDAGKIILHLSNCNGGEIAAPNFNIADTQFYKDAVSAAYSGGWAAAKAKVSVPTSTASGTSISIAFPTSTVDGAATTQNYTLSDDGNNKVKLTTPVTVNGNTSTVTVAEYTHNKYSSGYSNGSPSSGSASGRSGSSYAWTFKITKADGTYKNLDIDCSSIYSDARSGYYTQAQYNSYGTTRYNAGWDDHLNHNYAWFETSDSPCQQNYAMATGKYYRIYYVNSSGSRTIGTDTVNGTVKTISWGPVPSSGGAGTIDIPTSQITTRQSSYGTELTTLRNKFLQAQSDYDWVAFKVTCSCGASKWYCMDPHG